MKNAKRILSLMLCILMTLSMLTAIVLPTSAAEVSSEGAVGSEAIADPYAKVTGTENPDGSITPANNVVFVDPSWTNRSSGEAITYTYAGNSKTYTLTFGTNAFATMADFKNAMAEYATDWVNGEAASQDFVGVFAPGQYNEMAAGSLASKAATDVAPTTDELLNVYMLGAKAGVNPVYDERANAEDVRPAANSTVNNGRGINTGKESRFDKKISLPGNCNITIDGFAGKNNVSFVVENNYTNVKFLNLNILDITSTTLYSAETSTIASMWEFKNCYFNFSSKENSTTKTNIQAVTQDIYSTKTTFDNCAFINGIPAKNKNGDTHDGTYVTRLLVPSRDYANTNANFFGEYATSPELTVKNCVSADWQSIALFQARVGSNFAGGYQNNASVRYNFLDNKFYNFIGSAADNSTVIKLQDYKNITLKPIITITGNVFTASASVADDTYSNRNFSFIECGAGKMADNTDDGAPTNIYNDRRGSLGRDNGVNMTIKENVFKFPNEQFAGPDARCNPVNTADFDKVSAVDLSGNLFVDNENNVLPAWQKAPWATGFAVQSDIYASEAMCGGVREVLSVKDVKGGALLYNYIMLTISTDYSGGLENGSTTQYNAYNKDYFMGAATVLLKRGETYNPEDMFVFGDENTQVVGVYEEEACKTEVKTLTQDSFNNGKRYFLKATYTKNGTTATVVYGLNSPSYYYIVAPTNSDYYNNREYHFNGNTYTGPLAGSNQDITTVEPNKNDGVRAIFAGNLTGNFRNDQKKHIFEQSMFDPHGGPQGEENPEEKVNTVTAALYGYETANFGSAKFGMDSMILFTPGRHDAKMFSMPSSVAIVGPQFATSPYDTEKNANGELANGRGIDPSTEAILPLCSRSVNTLNANHFSYHGMVFETTTNGTDGRDDLEILRINKYAYMEPDDQKFKQAVDDEGNKLFDNKGNPIYNEENPIYVYFGWKRDSDYSALSAKNCIFNSSTSIAGGVDATTIQEEAEFPFSNLIDFRLQDSVYYTIGTEVATPSTFVRIEATRKVLENISILTQKCHVSELVTTPNRYLYKSCNWGTTFEDVNIVKDDVAIAKEDVVSKYIEHSSLSETSKLEPTYIEPGYKKYNCSVCKANDVTKHTVVATISGAGVDGEIEYYDMEEAFLAVEPNQTLTLQYTLDRTNPEGVAEYTIVDKNVIVDLNGHQLGTGYAVGFKGSAVIDTSEDTSGKLIVPQEKVFLDTTNKKYLPTYETDGYIFTTLDLARVAWNKYSDNDGKYQFSPRFNPIVHEPLKLGRANSANEVVLRLTWKEKEADSDGYVASQDFVYDDAYVKSIMNSYGANPKYPNDYRYTFWATLTRTDVDAAGITMYAIVRSSTGVEIVSNPLSFDTNSPVTPVE